MKTRLRICGHASQEIAPVFDLYGDPVCKKTWYSEGDGVLLVLQVFGQSKKWTWLLELEEKSEDPQSYYKASWGEHECNKFHGKIF